jgi:hypothetical protein
MLVLACSLCIACASYGPGALRPGASLSEVEATMGRPTAMYALPEGQRRAEYARGPAGLHTYMLDFDAAGRMTRAEQVLSESRFNALAPGLTQQQVLETLGHPGSIIRLSRQDRTVWAYSYESLFCTWFQISFAADGRVVEKSYGPDPRCERPALFF